MKPQRPVNPGGLEKSMCAENIKTVKTLRRYLCSMAVSPDGIADPEMCRICPSQCAYGRRYVAMTDAGAEDPKPSRKAKQKAEDKESDPAMEVKGMSAPREAEQAKEMRMQLEMKEKQEKKLRAELANALAETAEATRMVEELSAALIEQSKKTDSYAAELVKAGTREQETENEIRGYQYQLIKLKAKIYDFEHPEG